MNGRGSEEKCKVVANRLHKILRAHDAPTPLNPPPVHATPRSNASFETKHRPPATFQESLSYHNKVIQRLCVSQNKFALAAVGLSRRQHVRRRRAGCKAIPTPPNDHRLRSHHSIKRISSFFEMSGVKILRKKRLIKLAINNRQNMNTMTGCHIEEKRDVTDQFMLFPSAKPEKGLAAGVLKQAASDLRRFRTAVNGVRRELYLDAYTWIHENDFSWPYSFVNVCNLLDLCPDTVRKELLTDASLSWVNYWIRRAGRLFHRLRSFLVRA